MWAPYQLQLLKRCFTNSQPIKGCVTLAVDFVFLFIFILFCSPPPSSHFLVYELKFLSQNQVSIGSMKWKFGLLAADFKLLTCSITKKLFIFILFCSPPPIFWFMNSYFSANVRSPCAA